MIKRCVCCQLRMAEEKLEDGYCKSCLRAGMKEVSDKFLEQTAMSQLRDRDRG